MLLRGRSAVTKLVYYPRVPVARASHANGVQTHTHSAREPHAHGICSARARSSRFHACKHNCAGARDLSGRIPRAAARTRPSSPQRWWPRAHRSLRVRRGQSRAGRRSDYGPCSSRLPAATGRSGTIPAGHRPPGLLASCPRTTCHLRHSPTGWPWLQPRSIDGTRADARAMYCLVMGSPCRLFPIAGHAPRRAVAKFLATAVALVLR